MGGQLAKTSVIDTNCLLSSLRDINVESYFYERFFTIVYQPQFDYEKRLKGVEALLRLRISDNAISPEKFIPYLEANDLIPEVGILAAEKAIIDCKNAGLFAKGLTLSINVSVIQFASKKVNFIVRLLNIIDTYSVLPHQVIIELTEGYAVEATDGAMNTIRNLHHHGVQISLDDFGTGYRNFTQICDYPIAELKVDKSLVSGFCHYNCLQDNLVRKRDVIKGIIDICRSIGISVVSEGIETREHFESAKEIGFDIAQGFYFSHPISINELINADFFKKVKEVD